VTARVLRSDSLALAAFGLVLLLSPWDALHRTLDLPQPRPEVWTQLAGILLLAFAYLLWVAPRNAKLTQAVALTAATANLAGAALIAVWLGRGIDTGATGTLVLIAVAVAAAAYGAAEAWIASRSIAVLVPGD
jgi:hypothetical protein